MIYGKESIKVSILRLVLANYTQYQYKVSFFLKKIEKLKSRKMIRLLDKVGLKLGGLISEVTK